MIGFAAPPIISNDGEVTSTVGIPADMTRRKQYEQQLNALYTSTRWLMGATNHEEVVKVAREAVTEVLGYAISDILLYGES